MVRTRFAFMLSFRMVAHKTVQHTLSKAFLQSLVQILLMLEVFFTQDSEVEDLSACASAIISSAWGLGLFKMTLLE